MSKTFERRWAPARQMWEDGVPRPLIAHWYGLPDRSLAVRIQKWRKKYGWFPSRGENHKVSEIWFPVLNKLMGYARFPISEGQRTENATSAREEPDQGV